MAKSITETDLKSSCGGDCPALLVRHAEDKVGE